MTLAALRAQTDLPAQIFCIERPLSPIEMSSGITDLTCANTSSDEKGNQWLQRRLKPLFTQRVR